MLKIFAAATLLLALALPSASAAREIPTGDLLQPDGCPIADALGSPAGVRVTPVPEGLRIAWLPVPETVAPLEGFQVVRAIELEGPWQAIAVVSEAITEIIDPTAAVQTIYYYRVRAFGGGACGRYSLPVRGQR